MAVTPSNYDDFTNGNYHKQPRIPIIITEDEYHNDRSSRRESSQHPYEDPRNHTKDFEDALVDPSYAVSPLKPFRHFLDLGTLVGVFPAKHGDKHIYFELYCCSAQTIWAIIFTVIWFIWGLAVAGYCATNEGSVTKTNRTGLASVLEVKTTNANYTLTSTDQIVVVATLCVQLLAWILSLILSWSRIPYLAELCFSFCKRGFRIGTSPENRVILEFLINYFIFAIGQAIVNVQISLAYCSDSTKQILFSILITIWILPIYVVLVFNGYIFSQFTYTLTEYFRHLRSDIDAKSLKIGHGNILYAEVIKRGLPRRYDRLHDIIYIIDQAYGMVLLFEYLLYHILMVSAVYMSISSIITGIRTTSVPWWVFGYIMLACHHVLRMYQLAACGHVLQEEVKHVLNMLSQFGFIHGDLNMICLTIARKPTESLLTLAGWADLRRGLVGKTLAFVLVTMLLITNYKLKDY